jgi:hypothetical protein
VSLRGGTLEPRLGGIPVPFDAFAEIQHVTQQVLALGVAAPREAKVFLVGGRHGRALVGNESGRLGGAGGQVEEEQQERQAPEAASLAVRARIASGSGTGP